MDRKFNRKGVIHLEDKFEEVLAAANAGDPEAVALMELICGE